MMINKEDKLTLSAGKAEKTSGFTLACGDGIVSRVCDNVLNIDALIMPDAGKTPLVYRIAGIRCDAMPFLEHELLQSLSVRTETEEHKQRLCEAVKSAVCNLLEAYGFQAQVNASPVMTLPKSAESIGPFQGYVNLFVDLGSTNSKWIIVDADCNGRSRSFLDIPVGVPTKKLCGDWGLDYDKAAAYSLQSESEFVSWLSYAVLGFMLHIRYDRKTEIGNIKWSFPRIVKAQQFDFEAISQEVTQRLKGYGLKGNFELVPESKALFHMFRDRLVELARASEEEEAINRDREATEQANRAFNTEEHSKEDDNRAARAREAETWEKKHWIKSWFCAMKESEYSTSPYEAKYLAEELGRMTALKHFRRTGAAGDGKFRMLILDAGGSTLDYCYVPSDVSGKAKFGSYRAGGNDLTLELSKELATTEEQAEVRKRELSDLLRAPQLYKATENVYGRALKCIRKAIGAGDDLCVVVTGLAMCNNQLRTLIKKVLQLPDDQLLIYSPDIVAMFPNEKFEEYPKFRDFVSIVNRVCEGKSELESLPWPGADVCGGMYFKSGC